MSNVPQEHRGAMKLPVADPPLFLKTKMCTFNMQGRCLRGSACAFAHNQDELKAKPDFSKTRRIIKTTHMIKKRELPMASENPTVPELSRTVDKRKRGTEAVRRTLRYKRRMEKNAPQATNNLNCICIES